MAKKYTYTTNDEWEAGQVIEKENLNNIEEAIETLGNEVIGTGGNGTLNKRINDLVMIQDTQPTSENNEIWIRSAGDEVQVPTYEEFEDLVENTVHLDEQTLTDTQKVTARENIDAASTQDVSELKSALTTLQNTTEDKNETPVTLDINNGFYRTNGAWTGDNTRRSASMSVSPGDIFKLDTLIGSTLIPGIIFWLNSEIVDTDLIGSGTAQTITDYEIIIPNGVDTLTVQCVNLAADFALDEISYTFKAYTKSETDTAIARNAATKVNLNGANSDFISVRNNINLYNYETRSVNTVIKTNNGMPDSGHDDYDCTGFIPVMRGVPYKAQTFLYDEYGNTGVSTGVLFNSNKEYESAISSSELRNGTFIPSINGYVRLNISKSTFDVSLVYVFGFADDFPTGFAEYAEVPYVIAKGYSDNTLNKNGKGISFGDSITEFGLYPYYMSKISGIDFTNCGIGGTCMANRATDPLHDVSFEGIIENIVNGTMETLYSAMENTLDQHQLANLAKIRDTDFSEVDYVTIAYGTNDYAGQASIDNENNKKDITTTCGALRKGIELLLTVYPNIRFFVFTPAYRDRLTQGDGKNSDEYPNGAGKYLYEFAEAIKNASEDDMHVPCMNVYKESQVNKYNQSIYLVDGLHRTQYGYKVLGEQYGRFIISH